MKKNKKETNSIYLHVSQHITVRENPFNDPATLISKGDSILGLTVYFHMHYLLCIPYIAIIIIIFLTSITQETMS